MISTADVQRQIVTTLKANSALTALVGDEIREEEWMGLDYTYPCVRVHISRLSPIGEPGSCEDTGFVCDFSVSYRATTPSSATAADGLTLAVAALTNVMLEMTGVFVSRTGIVLQDVAGPIAEYENTWMARAFFNTRLQEV